MSQTRQLSRPRVLLATLVGLAQCCSAGELQGGFAGGLSDEGTAGTIGGPAVFSRAGIPAKENSIESARKPIGAGLLVELNDVHGASHGAASHHDDGAGGDGHGGEPFHEHNLEPAGIDDAEDYGIDTSRNHHHVAALEDIEVSAMLLGFLILIMLLFFLVNYKDDDIRLYTWKISSTTISIFTSVLLFQGINRVGEYVLVFKLHIPATVYQLCQCLIFLVLMQLITAKHSGVIWDSMPREDLEKEDWVYRDVLRADNDQKLVQEHQDLVNEDLNSGPIMRGKSGAASGAKKEEKLNAKLWIFKAPGMTWRVVEKKQMELIARKRRTVGWGMIFAHMAGFAAISMGCTLQNSSWFNWHWAMTLIPVVLVACLMRTSFFLTQLLRGRLHENLEKKEKEGGRQEESRPLTMPKSLGPEIADVRVLIFNHAVLESERESQALALSFLLIVALRYAILQDLAGDEGFEHFESADETPATWQVSILALVSVLFVILAGILTMFKQKAKEGVLQSVTLITGMTFAWGILFAVRWASLGWHYGFFRSIMGRVAVASLLTGVIAICIFILDFIDDRLARVLGHFGKANDEEAQRIAKSFLDMIIAAFAVLIGFSWELCFEGAVHDVASMTDLPILFSLIMAIVVATIVIIPWRRYIITKVMLLDQVRKDKRMDRREREASKEGAMPH